MPNRPVVVVKLGSSALLDDAGRLDLGFLDTVAAQLARIAADGLRPVVVSSGAVASGRGVMDGRVATNLPERQALAAIGQATLMHRWQVALAGHGLVGAQVLLTADDFDERERYLNLTASFRALFALATVPIVNENDTVAVEELTVGDNDRLSALLASQLGARQLVMLTDIDGVYDGDPRQDPAAVRLEEIAEVTPAMLAAAGDAGTHGRGGMRSKLAAAKLAADAGVEVRIAHAREAVLSDLVAGRSAHGTRMRPNPAGRDSAARRWLRQARSLRGRVTVDAGAVAALRDKGRSLLPAGITAVDGVFKRGDPVAILDPAGHEIARGLVGLADDELRPILGQRMDVASRTLGYALPKAAIHRDNLLLASDDP